MATTQLAGYDVVARIKTGGMAALYLGRKTGAGGFAKYVAIKVLLDHMSEDPNFVSMFLDEARLSARIEHPNVVHIHGLGEEDGQHFLIMEYVAGCSLAQLQRAMHKQSRRYAATVAAYIGMQVAAGLHAAHEVTDDAGEYLHVVHRDVSPKNILVAFKGYVKLIDFGIAKVRDATSQSTSAGALKGTIRYMSPEQAFGRSVDRRSDIFALGIVLWEMLAGRTLFDAESDFAVLDQVRTANVPPLSQFTKVSAALERVVMKMLKLAPSERYATADEVQRALAQAVPEALGFAPQRLGELVAALLPSVPSGQEIDPSIASALGRPMVLANAEEVLRRLASAVDAPSQVGVVPNQALAEQLAARAEYDALMDEELTSIAPASGARSLGTNSASGPPGQGPQAATLVPMPGPAIAPSVSALPSSTRALESSSVFPLPPKARGRAWALPALGALAVALLASVWGASRMLQSESSAPSTVAPTVPAATADSEPLPSLPQAPSHDVAAAEIEPPVAAGTEPVGEQGEAVVPAAADRRVVRGRRRAGGGSGASDSASASQSETAGHADEGPQDSPGTGRRGRPSTHVTDQPLISNTF